MTREEAIKMLKGKMDGHTDTSYEWAETVRMAIKALEQEPCDDCVSRQAAIDGADAIIARDTSGNNDVVKAMTAWKIYVEGLPPVIPAGKVGRWEYVQYDSNPNIGNWHCSECRTIIPHMPEETDNTPIYKWCPMCGAKMEVEE